MHADLAAQHHDRIGHGHLLDQLVALPAVGLTRIDANGDHNIAPLTFWVVVTLALERLCRAVYHASIQAKFERGALGFHARPLALESLVGEGEFTALFGLGHRDVETHVDGGCFGLLPRGRTWGLTGHTAHAAHAATAAEHLAENILKTAPAHAAHAAEIHRRSATSTAATAEHGAHLFLLVKFTSSFAGSDGVVGCLNFLEFRFGPGVSLVAIGMVLAGQFSEGSLDFTVAGLTADTQHLVRVPFCHRLEWNLHPTSTLP